VSSLEEAQRYVATSRTSGELQLELLKLEGCSPGSHVLEVGCGCLSAGAPVIRYLNRRRYVGIEPNRWLLDAALSDRRVRWLAAAKRPVFLERIDFDAGELGRTFDYVLAHSILSHCAHRQLEEFIRNVARVLRPHGRILASIRLAEGNAYGSSGTPDGQDSLDAQWQYPGVSWFAFDTVERTAAEHGLRVVVKPEYTERFIARRPREIHDWLVLSRPATGAAPAAPPS
jgi:cyclopropane fatty-acyl-phospholipid synthase-like methyltransferase